MSSQDSHAPVILIEPSISRSMNGLKACREGLEEVRRVLASDKLLTHDQMDRVVALMGECEREAAAYSSIVLEVRAAQMKR